MNLIILPCRVFLNSVNTEHWEGKKYKIEDYLKKMKGIKICEPCESINNYYLK